MANSVCPSTVIILSCEYIVELGDEFFHVLDFSGVQI
jgi:hypothetical protein